jgi:hypothetical protein
MKILVGALLLATIGYSTNAPSYFIDWQTIDGGGMAGYE